jgi:cytochrome c peroxidase
VSDPFATVSISTHEQKQGRKVFEKACMDCHSQPNVFNNITNVEPLGTNGRPVTDPAFGPSVGRNFNVGVSERNRFGLHFTRPLPDGTRTVIVLPLANEDGTTTTFAVDRDIGLAMSTGRMADVGRFKVPQLRGIKDAGPYFHDNSADTLEEVVDYFNSPAYNNSADGSKHPIHLNHEERANLLEFLRIL